MGGVYVTLNPICPAHGAAGAPRALHEHAAHGVGHLAHGQGIHHPKPHAGCVGAHRERCMNTPRTVSGTSPTARRSGRK